MGLMNGLSALGAGMAQFAGTAGLEQQKSDLAKESMTLADQLATTRESAGRQEAGKIAADAQATQNQFQAGEGVLNRQSAQAVAGIGAGAAIATTRMQIEANKDVREAQAASARASAALTETQTVKANAIIGLQGQLADEQASPNPDPAKLQSLTRQVTAFTTDAQTQAAVGAQLASLAATATSAHTQLITRRDAEVAAMQGITVDTDLKAQKQAAVDEMNQQIAASQKRVDALTAQAQSFIGGRANQPGAANAAGAVAPATGGVAPTGLINGGAATPFGAPGATTPAAGDAAASPAAAAAVPVTGGVDKPAATTGTAPPSPRAVLPGDTAGETNLDKIRVARPDLNLEPLKGRPQAVVNLVMAMVEGRATLPPLGSRSPDAIALRALAGDVDPTLDEASNKGRMATRVAFMSGPEARSMTSMNTSLGHAGHLLDAFDALNNFDTMTINRVWNAAATEFGGTGSAKVNNAKEGIDALANEARKVFAGGTGGGGLQELEDWKARFPINGSLDTQKEALRGFVRLLNSRLDSLGDQYNLGMGVTADPMTFLKPKARAAVTRITGEAPDEPIGRQLGNPRGATPPATKPAATSPAVAIPSWVKPGDDYSPSRNQARGANGIVYGEPQ